MSGENNHSLCKCFVENKMKPFYVIYQNKFARLTLMNKKMQEKKRVCFGQNM